MAGRRCFRHVRRQGVRQPARHHEPRRHGV